MWMTTYKNSTKFFLRLAPKEGEGLQTNQGQQPKWQECWAALAVYFSFYFKGNLFSIQMCSTTDKIQWSREAETFEVKTPVISWVVYP